MRVIADQAFETYFELRMLRIPEGLEIKGSLAAHLLRCGAPVRLVDGEPPKPAPDPDEPPARSDLLNIDGTAAEVLAWVGDDPDRARAAIEAESTKDRPRSTLLKRLEEIAA
ncbi:hypothetical protein OIE13_22340 [Streptosporangium sp. NBC_01810]|uniref:hypothetical protein n=1 Tax=Streptosporangium sp. NBC_01810 TaxID=2975951 RepID=UPI002DDB4470|nr:hypothetical protein [Streptosporangium sp. NBC_01810]WSA23683.1 hypothetical protein OIE13_22340 [Streptosporangium sp. NBC_01810]